MAAYKSFDINTVLTPKPWGTREEQVIKDIIDTLVGDTIDGVKQTSGHLHGKLYNSSSVAKFDASTSASITIIMDDDEANGLVIKDTTGNSRININSTIASPKIDLISNTEITGKLGINRTPSQTVEVEEANARIQITTPTDSGQANLGITDGDGAYLALYDDTGVQNVTLRGFGTSYVLATGFGFGTNAPEGTVHILTNSAGTAPPNTNADDLVVEGSSVAGISILTADTGNGYIYWGTPSDNDHCYIRGDYNNSRFTIGNTRATGDVRLNAGGSDRFIVDYLGYVTITSDQLGIATSKTPASAAATGTTGSICWDADYIYVCTATDTWKRAAIATW